MFNANHTFCLFAIVGMLGCTNSPHRNFERRVNNNQRGEDSLLTEMKFLNSYIEVGDIHKGDTANGKFFFVNSGENQLIVNYINPDCNCTNFYISKEKLNPGDTGFVVLQVKTDDKIGNSKVSAVICANTRLKLYKVTLEMNVKNQANEK